MSEPVQKKYSESGWGWLLGQITPVAGNILQRIAHARASSSAPSSETAAESSPTIAETETAGTTPETKGHQNVIYEVLSPLSPEKWINMMDDEGRFSPENAHELMRYAFYGVC